MQRMTMKHSTDQEPIIIKKYANRRLYDTSTSSYITLEDLCQMVKRQVDFLVIDAKTHEDITRIVLTQIIFEQEMKGYNLLPTDFLKNLIRLYDENMRWVVPSFLDSSMRWFTDHQAQYKKVVDEMMIQSPSFNPLETWSKKNMEMFSKAMDMFSMFNKHGDEPKNKP